jgi:hypothetical protein
MRLFAQTFHGRAGFGCHPQEVADVVKLSACEREILALIVHGFFDVPMDIQIQNYQFVELGVFNLHAKVWHSPRLRQDPLLCVKMCAGVCNHTI